VKYGGYFRVPKTGESRFGRARVVGVNLRVLNTPETKRTETVQSPREGLNITIMARAQVYEALGFFANERASAVRIHKYNLLVARP